MHHRSEGISAAVMSRLNVDADRRFAKVGVWTLDLASGEVAWSKELRQMAGLDATTTPPNLRDHEAFLTPESMTRMMTAVEETQRTGRPYQIELEGKDQGAGPRFFSLER